MGEPLELATGEVGIGGFVGLPHRPPHARTHRLGEMPEYNIRPTLYPLTPGRPLPGLALAKSLPPPNPAPQAGFSSTRPFVAAPRTLPPARISSRDKKA
jgi:hypothetical protein